MEKQVNFLLLEKSIIKNRVIEIDNNKFKKVIGIPISLKETKKILNSLGFKTKFSKNNFKIEIPSWRPDIIQDIDIIEELIRIKGFDKILLIHPGKKKIKRNTKF